ncbi:MAG: HPr family phosphocarrier protein [Myxococcota bacterium]
MPEVYFRVDPRLVHATVMNAWVPELEVGRLVIADAKVLADPRRRHILHMSAMDEVEVEFVVPARLGLRLKEGADALVLFSDVDSVMAAAEGGLAIDELNVGHLPATDGRSARHPAVHLGPRDVGQLERLQKEGTRVYLQPLPNDPPLAPFGIPRPVAVKRPRRPAPRSPSEGGVHRRRLQIVNERGLHLRAAHVLAHAAGKMSCEVRVGRNERMVNAKSLLGLTTLGAARGSWLDVEVEGPGAVGALDELEALFESGFTEGAGP